MKSFSVWNCRIQLYYIELYIIQLHYIQFMTLVATSTTVGANLSQCPQSATAKSRVTRRRTTNRQLPRSFTSSQTLAFFGSFWRLRCLWGSRLQFPPYRPAKGVSPRRLMILVFMLSQGGRQHSRCTSMPTHTCTHVSTHTHTDTCISEGALQLKKPSLPLLFVCTWSVLMCT